MTLHKPALALGTVTVNVRTAEPNGCGTDTGGSSAPAGELITSLSAPGRRFGVTVDPGHYVVDAWTGVSNTDGCVEVRVTGTDQCAADIDVELTHHVVDRADKPNLYLYPPLPSAVAVHIPAARRLTLSDPVYPVDGWRVIARPGGRLATPEGDRDFLFYEMDVDRDHLQRTRGWCVEGPLAPLSIEGALADMGFLPNEIADFGEAWDPDFPESPWMTVYPQLDRLPALRIAPEPDVILRAWFLVVDGCRNPSPMDLERVERAGFHAAEWGVAFEAPLEVAEVMIPVR